VPEGHIFHVTVSNRRDIPHTKFSGLPANASVLLAEQLRELLGPMWDS